MGWEEGVCICTVEYWRGEDGETEKGGSGPGDHEE